MAIRPLKLSKELTIRDSRAVDLYFQEINKIPLLTPDEEADLCERIQNGDEKAREELVTHNLKFVISVAKRYQSLGFRLGDLIAIGNMGLLRAAEKFDYSRGFKFISYAVWWIRQQIMTEIGFKNNGIRLPSNRVTIMYRIARFKDKFYKEHSREPGFDEIAEEFGIEPELARDLVGASSDLDSLNAPAFGDDDPGEAMDFMADEGELEDERLSREDEAKKTVRHAMECLDPKEQLIVTYAFGLDGKTLELNEIAELLGEKPGSVRKQLNNAMEKMKSKLEQKK